MATYVIGDVQGCYDELIALLESLRFRADADQLWFAGDLVNRGPKSLQTLRFAKEHATVTVLGNHDLHLLASAEHPGHRKRKDTLADVLDAPDRNALLDWLRRQPLLHYDKDQHTALLHAGLPPQWDIQQAQDRAREVETVLRSDNWHGFLEHMYGNRPDVWSDTLEGWDRLRFITNCFTRLRYCSEDGHLALEEKGPPGSQGYGLKPWFQWPRRHSRSTRILFGHWSTLGAYDGDNVHALDTGCLWGGSLTALRLTASPERLSVDCPGARKPPELK